MYKRIFFHGLISGILAAVAAIIYSRIYFFATEVDFSKVVNAGSIIGINLIAGQLAGIIYWMIIKFFNEKGEVIFNFLFSLSSFACILFPISFTLPLDVQFPELFPGLAVPMVFFPALSWFTIRPFFNLSFKQSS